MKRFVTNFIKKLRVLTFVLIFWATNTLAFVPAGSRTGELSLEELRKIRLYHVILAVHCEAVWGARFGASMIGSTFIRNMAAFKAEIAAGGDIWDECKKSHGWKWVWNIQNPKLNDFLHDAIRESAGLHALSVFYSSGGNFKVIGKEAAIGAWTLILKPDWIHRIVSGINQVQFQYSQIDWSGVNALFKNAYQIARRSQGPSIDLVVQFYEELARLDWEGSLDLAALEKFELEKNSYLNLLPLELRNQTRDYLFPRNLLIRAILREIHDTVAPNPSP